MATCPNCGNQTGEGAVFCDQCGTRLSAPAPSAPQPAAPAVGGSVICPACGAGNVPGEAFCDFCGTPLAAPEPVAEVEAEIEEAVAEAEAEAAAEAPAVEAVPSAPPDAGDRPPQETGDRLPETPEAQGLTCPACGAEVRADEAFCADCGASLAEPPIPPEAVEDVVETEVSAAEPEADAAALDAELEAEIAAVEEELAGETPAGEVEAVTEVVEIAPAAEAMEEAAPVAAVVADEAEAEAPPPPEPAPEAPAVPTCPACGAEVEPGDKFCSNCGAVQEVAAPPKPVEDEAEAVPPLPAAGPRLVVVSSGAEIPLPAKEEILIGREDPVSGIFPDVDLTPHGGEEGGVSRRHARLHVEGTDYYVEDLDSTNFTFVNKQKLAANTRQALADGDELRCGRVAMVLKAS